MWTRRGMEERLIEAEEKSGLRQSQGSGPRFQKARVVGSEFLGLQTLSAY